MAKNNFNLKDQNKIFNLILISVVLVALVVIVLCAINIVSSKSEINLYTEINEISTETSDLDANIDDINSRLSTNVTSGNYAVVEGSLKEYLSDYVTASQELYTVMDSEIFSSALTSENYINDGPDFDTSFSDISATRDGITEKLSLYSEFASDDKLNSYRPSSLNKKYIDLFDDIGKGIKLSDELCEKVTESCNNEIGKLDDIENVLNYLKDNQDAWIMSEDGEIMFSTDEQISEYNALVQGVTDSGTK